MTALKPIVNSFFLGLLIVFSVSCQSCSSDLDETVIANPADTEEEIPEETPEETPAIDEVGMAFVKDMGMGWNLGNTLDAKGEDETVWGNPVTTKEMIDAVKAKGFKTLRVPVTWQYHIGGESGYEIEQEWLNRVEEVVNYGLDNDMYVIVNIHHDEEWLTPTYEEVDQVKERLEIVWTQIANHFKEYDHHLIFETLNETRLKDSPEEWTGGTPEGRECINRFHDASVKAIRETGGNNTDRKIMISTYAASARPIAMNGLVLPNDSNLFVSIHNYYPYEFCLNNETDWGTQEEIETLDQEFERIYETFIAKGIPVVMGEWANFNNNNLEARVKHAQYYVEGAISRGICLAWWDNGLENEFALLDRNTKEWIYPEIVDAIMETYVKTK